MHDVALLALAFGVALAVVLTLSITGQAIVHWRLSIALRAGARHAEFVGRSVGVVPGRGIALVAGIRRPATYLSNDVVAVLSADELAAVIAHERHHERARAPFRLIVLAGIAIPFRFVPPIGRWVERARGRIEIEADAAALAEGSSRLAIARAIIKLGHEQSTPTGFASFASSADLRLRALLDAEGER
ncbi:MAG: hypothetical protein ACRDGQ_03785, partial [Candidatus Limnocylindrales bacterium]